MDAAEIESSLTHEKRRQATRRTQEQMAKLVVWRSGHMAIFARRTFVMTCEGLSWR